MPNQQPLIAAALICERVLNENGVFSAIRIVDTYTMRITKITPLSGTGESVDSTDILGRIVNADQVLDVTALVMAKAGDLRGKHEMTVEMEGPDGKSRKYPEPFRINFAKDDPAEAAVLTIKFALAGSSPAGRYWINVFWNGEPLTKIPFRLVRESLSPVSEAGAEQSQ
jgi:hypothetical protein